MISKQKTNIIRLTILLLFLKTSTASLCQACEKTYGQGNYTCSDYKNTLCICTKKDKINIGCFSCNSTETTNQNIGCLTPILNTNCFFSMSTGFWKKNKTNGLCNLCSDKNLDKETCKTCRNGYILTGEESENLCKKRINDEDVAVILIFSCFLCLFLFCATKFYKAKPAIKYELDILSKTESESPIRKTTFSNTAESPKSRINLPKMSRSPIRRIPSLETLETLETLESPTRNLSQKIPRSIGITNLSVVIESPKKRTLSIIS